MKLDKSTNPSNYDEYKNLILKRDKLKKLAFQYQESYYRTFGELLKQAFQIKIECIKLKKKITYCQMCLNQYNPIRQSDMDQHIQIVMDEYYEELEDLIHHIEVANKAQSISLKDFQEIKKIYRSIVKKIHPDLHPKLFEKEEIKELWYRTVLAYECNDLEELEEIKVLVDSLGQHSEIMEIHDIHEKLEKLKKQIHEIKNSEPYQFKSILENPEEIENTKNEIKEEIETYKIYKNQLESIFHQFEIIVKE